MNGRCETDPLDQAVDVCDSCFGEFCHACLVRPKGRRHPVCTDCALIASGVRTGAQPERRGSKRSVKKRREALKENATSETKVFEYFDTEPSADTAATSESDGQTKPESTDPAEKLDPATESGIETASEPMEPMGDAASSTETSITSAEGAEEAAGLPGDLPGPPAGTAPAGAEEPTTPAVARLNEIRQSTEQDQRGSQATTETETGSGAGPGPGAVPETANGKAGLVETPVAKSTEICETDPVRGSEGQKPARKPRPPVATPRRRQADQAEGDQTRAPQQATAPMIGEVRVTGDRRRAEDVEPEPPPSADPVAAEVGDAAGSEGRNAVDRFDTDQPPGGSAAATDGDGGGTIARKADTDATGNWIPPILRGMAPDAREAKASLPQRRKPPED